MNDDKEAEISGCNWFKLFQENIYKAKMCIVEDPSVDIISQLNNGYEDIIKGFPVYIGENAGAFYEFQSINDTDTYISIENSKNN